MAYGWSPKYASSENPTMAEAHDVSALGRVAVLMGGTAAEREISLRSGKAVHAALTRVGVDAHAVDFRGRDELLALPGRFDRVFIVVHGRGGEDGTLQGALETLGIPYTGSGVLASALSMDKARTKRLWQGCGLPTPAWMTLDSTSTFDDVSGALAGPPFMVKPAREGSSLGVSLVTDEAGFLAALEAALALDPLVFAEQYIRGGEYTAPILDQRALPLVKLEPRRAFYDYTAKYVSNDTTYRCPCGLPAEAEAAMQALALDAFNSLGCSVWGRIDFMRDEAGQPWLIEANTVPGMTELSLLPMAAREAGISFEALVLAVLAATLPQGSVA
jgi:D-alanine-D-alanine ligase